MHARDPIGKEAAEQPDGMTIHGISWSRGFGEWREEEQVGRRTKRGKDKGAVRDQSERGQQRNRYKAVEKHVYRPDDLRREVCQQPIEAKLIDQREDMVSPAMIRGKHHGVF